MAARRDAADMPGLVPPMMVSAGSGQPPTGPDWVVELAWTGHRCIAYVEPGRRTRLLSANDVAMTAAYPELAAPLERRSPPRGMVLDGTLVARGEEHAPRARLLKSRSARFRPSEGHIRAVPVDFQVADLLWLDGHSIVELPYRDRRSLLEGLGFDSAPVWTTSPLPVSEMETMLRIADAKGVDALHAHHLGSRYKPGGRSPLWVRVPVPRVREVVVGGWTPTDPASPDVIASLLLGVPAAGGGLRYVGRVGVTGDQRRQVARLRKLRRNRSSFVDDPPAGAAQHAIWVQPRLVGVVEFTGWVAGGRLRLPSWRGLVEPPGVHPDDVEPSRWARPPEPPPRRDSKPAPPLASPPEPSLLSAPTPSAPTRPVGTGPAATGPATAQAATEPVAAASGATASGAPASGAPEPAATEPARPEPATAVTPVAAAVETRRLEQHFVYNALNTIAALIRTDPGRARELLFGFADLSRAADQPGDSATTLGRELEAVRGYLQLEQARFGKRLRVELELDAALAGVPVEPMRVLGAVRAAVQRGIEPRPDGGVLALGVRAVNGGCVVTITGGSADPEVILLPTADVVAST